LKALENGGLTLEKEIIHKLKNYGACVCLGPNYEQL